MTGLEPATSGVTGRRSNQLSYIRTRTPHKNGNPRKTRGASNMSGGESCQRPMRSQGASESGFS